jgi:hypothetical protein
MFTRISDNEVLVCDNDILFSFRPNFFRSESERNYSDFRVTHPSYNSQAVNFLSVHLLVRIIFLLKNLMGIEYKNAR